MTAVEDPRPLCFVLMPFGTKPDPGSNVTIKFDAIYQEVIRPAIEAAGLKAIRADEERVGGIIHKPMFERLILCDFAVADLTTANTINSDQIAQMELRIDGKGVVNDAIRRPFILWRVLMGLLPF